MLIFGKSILETLSVTDIVNEPACLPVCAGGLNTFEQEKNNKEIKDRKSTHFFMKISFL